MHGGRCAGRAGLCHVDIFSRPGSLIHALCHIRHLDCFRISAFRVRCRGVRVHCLALIRFRAFARVSRAARNRPTRTTLVARGKRCEELRVHLHPEIPGRAGAGPSFLPSTDSKAALNLHAPTVDAALALMPSE